MLLFSLDIVDHLAILELNYHLCWLLRMGNTVKLHLHPVSILHVELHPSPEPIWSEIGISQFLLDLFQFRFSMLWRTEPVPFGTRAIQIWTRSIPVSLLKMRKWYQRRNRRRRRRKPSAITNITIILRNF